MPNNTEITKSTRPKEEQLLLNELQLMLAEKRTYLALLRTGLAVFTVPLTVIALLIATKDYHRLFSQIWLAVITIGGLTLISLIGLSIFYRADRKINRLNRLITTIEQENKRIAEIMI